MVLILAISACVAPLSPKEGKCHDAEVTVTHRAGSLDVHPEYVALCSNRLLTIHIVPPVGVDEAETKDDPSNATPAPWIAKKNGGSSDRIVIQVPNNTPVDTYKYSITIKGIGTLDPRARIKR